MSKHWAIGLMADAHFTRGGRVNDRLQQRRRQTPTSSSPMRADRPEVTLFARRTASSRIMIGERELDALKLIVGKTDLVRALRVLGTNPRRRFSSVVPVWLSYESGELRILDEREGVAASVVAAGAWPAAGATVNVFALRRAAEAAQTEEIELIAVEEAILVPTALGQVSLDLLHFGPDGAIPPTIVRLDRHSDLPLFAWAGRRGL